MLKLPIVAVVFLLLLASPISAQDDAETLKIGYVYQDINGWDPHNRSNNNSLLYYDFLYDTLFWVSPEGEIEPRLATDWELTETALTLSLREGVRFHDGTAFNAEAAAANIERAQTTGNSSVQNAYGNVASVEVLDEYSVRLNLSRRDDLLPLRLTGYAGMMASPAAFDTLGEFPVGTGGWTFNAEESIPASLFVYERFADHWADAATNIGRVEISVLAGPTGADALLAGDIDAWVTALPLSRLAVGDDLRFETQEAVWYLMGLWDRNGEQVPALANRDVRCALNHAINREAYQQNIDGGRSSVMATIPPVGWYGYNPEATAYSYDPELAASLLAEAGVGDVAFNLPAPSGFAQQNQAVSGFFSELGVNAQVENVPDGNFTTDVYAGEYAVAFINANIDHFSTFVADYLLPDGLLNPFGYVDERIEALYNEAIELPLAEAEPLWQAISQIVQEECYFIPVSAGSLVVVFAPEVVGIEPALNQSARYDLHALRIER